jgi:phenylpropionate dioxygenase-like ring-hydroxylating dioxygenase large terminal subunit
MSSTTIGNQLTAGGLNPESFDWSEMWYPIHYVKDLDQTKPFQFTLLDQDLVIWWDRKLSIWRAFIDQCPHRLVPLSEGRINEDGLLECPYHGWTFTGEGKCDRIPQQLPNSNAQSSPRACIRSFSTIIKQGLLFVYAGNPENASLVNVPIIEPMEEAPESWICLDIFRDIPYNALTLLENVLDPSHLPYTHHNTVGKRENAAPVELEVLESGKLGFKGTWAEGPRRGKLGRQDTTFIAPLFMYHDLTSKQFGRTLTVVYATPISKGKCRLFARFPFQFSSKLPELFIKLTPRWYSHIGQNGILEDDQIFLHSQERYLEQKGGSENFAKAFYLPTKADLFVSELRKWVNKYSIDPFPQQTFSPKILNKGDLLDRYHSHTVNCSSCRTALNNIKKSRIGLAIAIFILLAITPVINVFSGQIPLVYGIIISVLTLICGGVWFGLGELEKRFYQGREIPPRNQ